MDEATWHSWFEPDGTPKIRKEEMRHEVFKRGIAATGTLRKEIWPHLLGVYEWEVTQAERLDIWEVKR